MTLKNLRDLKAVTGLVILLKLDSNRRFFACVTLKFDGWANLETTNLGQIRRYLEPCDLEIRRMTLKTIGHLLYATSSFVQHFVAIGEFKLELQSGNTQSGSNSTIFCAVWPWYLTDDLQKQ